MGMRGESRVDIGDDKNQVHLRAKETTISQVEKPDKTPKENPTISMYTYSHIVVTALGLSAGIKVNRKSCCWPRFNHAI